MINNQLQQMREFGFNHFLFDTNSGADIKDIQKWANGERSITGIKLPPNKKFEDVIDVFAHYGKEYNEKCQLIFAGNININIFICTIKFTIEVIFILIKFYFCCIFTFKFFN